MTNYINYIYIVNILYIILLLLVYLYVKRRKYFSKSEPFYRCFVLGSLIIALEVISIFSINNKVSFSSWFLQIIINLYTMVENFFVVVFLDHHLFLNKIKHEGLIHTICLSLVVAISVLSFFFPFEFIENESMFVGRSIAFKIGYILIMIVAISISVIALTHKNNKDKRTTFINILVSVVLFGCSIIQLIFGHFINSGGIVVLSLYSILFESIGYSNEFGDLESERFELPIFSSEKFKEDFEKESNEFIKNKQRFYLLAYCYIDDYKNITNNQGYNVANTIQLICSRAIGIECKSAMSIYQIEDDKYVIIYKDIVEDVCKNELLNVYYTFSNLSEANDLLANITIGYAKSTPNYNLLVEILNSANFITRHNQEKKSQLKANEQIVYETEFNLTGLSEKIFESMCFDTDTMLPFIINLETNLSRVSYCWKELFDLDDEILFDFSSIWIPHILKEDQRKFLKEYNELINGDAKSGIIKFNALDAKGNNIECEFCAKAYVENNCRMLSGYMRTNLN